MPYGQLNPFATAATADLGRRIAATIEDESMIEKGFGRITMHTRALQSRIGGGGRLAGRHFGHFDVRIDRTAVGTQQILAAND